VKKLDWGVSVLENAAKSKLDDFPVGDAPGGEKLIWNVSKTDSVRPTKNAEKVVVE